MGWRPSVGTGTVTHSERDLKNLKVSGLGAGSEASGRSRRLTGVQKWSLGSSPGGLWVELPGGLAAKGVPAGVGAGEGAVQVGLGWVVSKAGDHWIMSLSLSFL